MYNRVGGDRASIEGLLAARTARFRAECDPSDASSLLAYKREQMTREAPDKLLGLLRNCPFLGVLDDDTGRVGCMVHPRVTGGIDARDCGVYDRETCESYLCAAYTVLSDEERRVVIEATGDDSYLYGLILNDVKFHRALYAYAADITGMTARGRRLFAPRVLATIQAWFELKSDWPWVDPEAGVIGAWLPDGDRDVVRRTIDYPALGVDPSRFDDVLRSLGSHFDEVDDLREAEAVIWGRVTAFAEAWERVLAEGPDDATG